jgi:hypothetical protein
MEEGCIMDENMKRWKELAQWMNIWELKLHHGLNTKENKYKMDKKFIQFFIMDEKLKFIQWTKS